MNIGIFEDSGYENLQPLTYLRPTFDLRCGMYLLREKLERYFKDKKIIYFMRNILKDFFREKNPGANINTFNTEDILLLNGRALFQETFLEQLKRTNQVKLFLKNNEVVAAFITKEHLSKLEYHADGTLDFSAFKVTEDVTQNVTLPKYSWDFIHENPGQITTDYNTTLNGKTPPSKERPGVFLLHPNQICISDTAQVDPGVVINAEDGPVYIDENAHIFPQATIIGPAYIGKKSLVKIGAKIYEGTSIGEVCKVGGEVEESIIHSYSNKQHDGFLGHAYLGQWVNLGADTNNSDLKNNYGPVRAYINGKEVDSGSTFVGLTLGDHSKTGINTMFNTGTVAGIMCNLYGANFLPKWIPSFSWGGSEGLVEYNLEKALEVAIKVMERRKITLGEKEQQLIRHVFEQTKDFRNF